MKAPVYTVIFMLQKVNLKFYSCWTLRDKQHREWSKFNFSMLQIVGIYGKYDLGVGESRRVSL